MCEFCEAQAKDDLDYRCNKCNKKVCIEKNKCDKEGCDGVPLFEAECMECGKNRLHRPRAWICEVCIVKMQEIEKTTDLPDE